MVIGVMQEYQGMGHGAQMLKYLCERADQETKAIYLETQTEMNVGDNLASPPQREWVAF